MFNFNALPESFPGQIPARAESIDTVLQASSCLKLAGNATACTRKPYCVWERDVVGARQVCMHRDTAARAADAYSQELARIKVRCVFRLWGHLVLQAVPI